MVHKNIVKNFYRQHSNCQEQSKMMTLKKIIQVSMYKWQHNTALWAINLQQQQQPVTDARSPENECFMPFGVKLVTNIYLSDRKYN